MSPWPYGCFFFKRNLYVQFLSQSHIDLFPLIDITVSVSSISYAARSVSDSEIYDQKHIVDNFSRDSLWHKCEAVTWYFCCYLSFLLSNLNSNEHHSHTLYWCHAHFLSASDSIKCSSNSATLIWNKWKWSSLVSVPLYWVQNVRICHSVSLEKFWKWEESWNIL